MLGEAPAQESRPSGSRLSFAVRHLGKGPLFLGFPLIGIVGYLIAAMLGLWLAVAILRAGKLSHSKRSAERNPEKEEMLSRAFTRKEKEMRIFVSWSGDRSKFVAEALHDWLPNVIQALDPWLSSEDIDKGTRWLSDIATQLNEVKVGIICLTFSS